MLKRAHTWLTALPGRTQCSRWLQSCFFPDMLCGGATWMCCLCVRVNSSATAGTEPTTTGIPSWHVHLQSADACASRCVLRALCVVATGELLLGPKDGPVASKCERYPFAFALAL
jgi:hypothetical protein